MIRQWKMNTDAAATAYAWEHSLPMDRSLAVKALAEDICDYMEDLIHKKKLRATPATLRNKPWAHLQRHMQRHRVWTQPHHTALHSWKFSWPKHNIQYNAYRPTYQTSQVLRQVKDQRKHQQHEREQFRSTENTFLPDAAPDVVEIPESIPASQDTIIFSPSGRPMLDQEEPSPSETSFNPKRKLTFTSTHSSQSPRGAAASTQGAEASAPTRPPAKKFRQATLTGKPAPAAKQAGEIFNTTAQPSAWFAANYTGVHTESGIARWFGGLKIPDKKKNEVRQYIEGVMRQFPSISEEQRSNLDRHAVAQGIAVRAVARFADAPLMKLLSRITAMSE